MRWQIFRYIARSQKGDSVTPLRQRMLEELQRCNYNSDTVRGYIHAVKKFAEYFGEFPEVIGAEQSSDGHRQHDGHPVHDLFRGGGSPG
jgi:hypothetical protein